MSSIEFTVTNKPLSFGRLNTEQEYQLNRFTNVAPLQASFNRSYARSLDRRSGRGTLVSSSTEITIDFVVPIDEEDEFDELLYSLADYQIAILDLTDRPAINKVFQIVMIGDSFNRTSKSCNWINASITFQTID